MENIYEDVSHVDLGSQISRLEEQNKILLNHINKLEDDIKKLCTELTNMKEIQRNLSRNISELFKTAKVELQRKDRMISELRQEIDSLVLNKDEHFKRNKFKRKLHERNINDAPKRFKSHSIDQEIDRKSNSPARSTSTIDSVKTEPHDIQEKDFPKITRNHQNDNYNRSLRYSPLEDHGRYHRMDAGYERRGSYNRCRSNGKFRRSSSRDRYRKSRDNGRRSDSRDKDRRSKSSDRYNRNRNRWKRNRTPEQTNKGDKNVTKETYESSDHFSFKNYDDFDFDNDNRSLHKTKEKLNELLDLTEDIEDGEITTENDVLIIEEKVQDTQYVSNRQSNFPSKLESKPITIDEYRIRKKHMGDVPMLIAGQSTERPKNKMLQNFDEREKPDFTTDTNIKTQETTINDNSKPSETTSNDKNRIPETNTNSINKTEETRTFNGIQEEEIATKRNEIPKEKCVKNKNELQNTIVEDSPHILNRNISKDLSIEDNATIHDKTSNDVDPNKSNMLNDSGSTSVNSDSSFLNNSGNISNISSSNLIKTRRRRCVVIGLKEKT